MKKSVFNKSDVIEDYKSGFGVEALASKYHTAKKRIKGILKEANVPMKTVGAQEKLGPKLVSNWRIPKFHNIDGFHYEAHSKDGKYKTLDYMNAGGMLTSYIKKAFGVSSTLYERRVYYMKTGNYWWEQWFDIVSVKNKETKKCKLCNWETSDIDNKSGAFVNHLITEHKITPEEYLKQFPEESVYLRKTFDKIQKVEKFRHKENFTSCPICGEKMSRITPQHIFFKHHLTFEEFKNNYPDIKLSSDKMYEETIHAAKIGNLTVSKKRFVSKYEKEIQKFLKEYGISFSSNRQILIGKEIDILINDKKIGIEFDGLKFHTEWFGKKPHRYHLEKTEKCNNMGYGLIHIFEDEYVNHKDIVYSKLSHILGIQDDKKKIFGRNCIIKEIYKFEAETFLNKFHIQGFSSSTLYLGAFYNEKLIAVMSFKRGNLKNPYWELSRYATDSNYICPGVGGKLFSFFVRTNNPDKVVSFADRRWTINKDCNFYTKLGFKLESVNPPDYKYYNERVDRYKRVHKMFLNKKKLVKQYGFPETMTETEMAKALGYDRIWDCGLFKYVWKNI